MCAWFLLVTHRITSWFLVLDISCCPRPFLPGLFVIQDDPLVFIFFLNLQFLGSELEVAGFISFVIRRKDNDICFGRTKSSGPLHQESPHSSSPRNMSRTIIHMPSSSQDMSIS